MGRIRQMNWSGDTIVTWDHVAAAAGDVEAQAAVKEAERIFTEARAKGVAAFRIDTADPQKRGERIAQFDPQATEIVLLTPMAGG